jgi:predicted nucleotidyltransferase
MRVPEHIQKKIKVIVAEMLGNHAEVYVFGSRLNDDAKGGDLDLLVVTQTAVAHPAQVAANLSVAVSRQFYGRKVDVILKAPNITVQPIHQVAQTQGQRL